MEEHDEPRSEIDWRLARTMQLSFSGLIVFVMVVIWIATGFGDYFWPIWVWFGLMIPIALQYAIRRASKGPRQWRALNTHASLVVRRGRHPDLHLGRDRLRVLALLAAVRHDRRARPARAEHGLVARAAPGAREGADRARGRADPHAPRRAGRAGRRAAPDRARPARRRAGPPGRALACSSAAPRTAWRSTPRPPSSSATPASRPPTPSRSCATSPAASRRRSWPTAACPPPSSRSASAARCRSR